MRRQSNSAWMTVVLLLSGSFVMAQDTGTGDEPPAPVKIYGSAKLAPPAEAANQEAIGMVKLRQWGERMGIHVYVWHLEGGATYDVSITREKTEGGTETAALGTITTRDGTPPLPYCFRAFLKVPEEPAPEDTPDGAGAWWFGGGDGTHDRMPAGMAWFLRNHEGTELSYQLFVRGEVTEALLDLGDGTSLDLPLDERLRGSVAVTAEQLAIVAAGDAVLKVTVKAEDDTETEISGQVKECFPFLDDWRARMAERLVGTGALRLDTARGDAMPFGVTGLEELVGATVDVKQGETVVLTGIIGELKECPVRAPAPDGAGASLESDEQDILTVADDAVFFGLEDIHDASFIRGDVNDDGSLDISDPVCLLGYLFLGSAVPYCSDAGDANDNGELDLSDAVFMLGSLFQVSQPIPAPNPDRGFDRTADGLFCGAQ